MIRCIVNMCVFFMVSVLLMMQTDELGRPLFEGYHGIMYTIIACLIMFAINGVLLGIMLMDDPETGEHSGWVDQ